MVRMKALADCKITDTAAETFLRRVLTYSATADVGQPAINQGALKSVQGLYNGHGMGAELGSWHRLGLAVFGGRLHSCGIAPTRALS